MINTDDDFLDGCDLDFKVDPDDDEVLELRALFPRGQDDAALADEWTVLFRIDPQLRSAAPLTATAYTGGRDLGIADRLRAAGLIVVEVAGWRTRGSTTFNPKGSVDHHTAGGRNGNAPSLNICINGRSDLAGPLCNVLVGRDNTCYVIAAGRANHAGSGGYAGLAGNSSVYGVERENVGTKVEPWSDDQTVIAAKIHAALLRDRGVDSSKVCRHAEWTPRKIDTHTITGNFLRGLVAKFMGGVVPPSPGEDDDVAKFQTLVLTKIVSGKPTPDEWVILDDSGVVTYTSSEQSMDDLIYVKQNGGAQFVPAPDKSVVAEVQLPSGRKWNLWIIGPAPSADLRRKMQ